MRARLRGNGGRFALLGRLDAAVGTSSLRPADRDEALRILRRNLSGSTAAADIRAFSALSALAPPTDAALLRSLADRIVTGTMRLERFDDVWNERGALPAPPKPPDPTPPGPSPKPKPEVVTQLVVTVKTLDGKPVDKAEVMAGALGPRYTGKDGVADFGNVAPGTYDITAEKEGHGKTRNGPVVKDEKKAVAVPAGSRTAVTLIQHPDCANVAFFEGPPDGKTTGRNKYFGFDPKTDLPEDGKHPYWEPVPDKGTPKFPGSREERDGGRWVSVAVGKETELEINFAFKGSECIPCIANCVFEVTDPKVAKVVGGKVTEKKAKFSIMGLAAGEASLRVKCDGNDIGWFHIWCEVPKELLVDVACIVTTRTSQVVYDAIGLSTYMNRIFRQLLITLNLKDLGTIDLSGNAALAAEEGQSYPAGKLFQQDTDGDSDKFVLTAIDDAAMSVVAARKTGPMGRAGARRLYWYVPNVGAQWGGMNLEIGHPATFIFFGESVDARNTGAHEIGHSIRLRHPSDHDGKSHFASHNLKTLNLRIPEYPETNTEYKSASRAAHVVTADNPTNNILANDPTNLMGYWHAKSERKYLRYHQWKATDRS